MKNSQLRLEDENVRNTIYSDPGNIVVTASAGTGKTFTIIKKIQNILETKNFFQKIAAITFSKKAADEIKDRLKASRKSNIQSDFIFTGTMHSWVVNEIIEPFYDDYYPLANDIQITPYFGNQRPPIATYTEGILEFQRSGYLMPYVKKRTNNDTSNNFRYGNDGYDFIFDFALDILKKSTAAKKYLQNAYTTIFIDEYQDVNKSQHELISFIVNDLKIRTCIFGDNKQELYGFRGANPYFLNSFIQNNEFHHYELTTSFRSSDDIVKYSKAFANSTNFVKISSLVDVNIMNQTTDLIPIVKAIRRKTENETILILLSRRYRNGLDTFENIKNSSSIFKDFFIEKPLAYAESDNADILSQLVKIIFGNYTLYDLSPFIEESKIHNNFNELNTSLNNIINKCTPSLELALKNFFSVINSIYTKRITENDLKLFLDTINNSDQLDNILQRANALKILTIHGSKGLEADNVIIFGNDFFEYNQFQQNLHYVAITRAKKKLIILNSNNLYQNMLKNKCNILMDT